MSEHSSPKVSVIVPVFNAADHLMLCLDALEKQSYPTSQYEVIVVDNGSTEDIRLVTDAYAHVQYYCETEPGSYAARNTGIKHSSAELIAFTDADCIPSPNWIRNGVNAFVSIENCGLIAGHINLFFKNSNRPTPVELYDHIKIGFPQDRFIEESQYGATANLFTSKTVFKTVGLFNATLKSSGDREWGQRVFSAGYDLAYAHDACVAHPARRTWRELYKKVVRIIGGRMDLKKEQGYSWMRLYLESIRDSIKDFLPPFRMYFYIWSYDSLNTHHQRFQFLSAMLFVRYVRGWERLRLLLGGISSRG